MRHRHRNFRGVGHWYASSMPKVVTYSQESLYLHAILTFYDQAKLSKDMTGYLFKCNH